jgi:hypothetical protein
LLSLARCSATSSGTLIVIFRVIPSTLVGHTAVRKVRRAWGQQEFGATWGAPGRIRSVTLGGPGRCA